MTRRPPPERRPGQDRRPRQKRQGKKQPPPAAANDSAPSALLDPPGKPGTPGRPRIELTGRDYAQAETLAGYGLTQKQIGEVLGLAQRTFEARVGDDPELVAALTRGRSKAEAMVGEALFLLAVGKAEVMRQEGRGAGTRRVYLRPPDIQAIRWWEMTRAGRREVVRTEVDDVRDETERPLDDRLDEIEGILSLGAARARRAAGGGAPG